MEDGKTERRKKQEKIGRRERGKGKSLRVLKKAAGGYSGS